MIAGKLRVLFVTVLLFALVGCSAQARRVDCRWGLEPINTPAAEREDRESP